MDFWPLDLTEQSFMPLRTDESAGLLLRFGMAAAGLVLGRIFAIAVINDDYLTAGIALLIAAAMIGWYVRKYGLWDPYW